MLISECNGKISELRAKGYVIETSENKDKFGFVYHRLVDSALQVAAKVEELPKPKYSFQYDEKRKVMVQTRMA